MGEVLTSPTGNEFAYAAAQEPSGIGLSKMPMHSKVEQASFSQALQVLAVANVDEGVVGKRVAPHRQRRQLHPLDRRGDQVFRAGGGGKQVLVMGGMGDDTGVLLRFARPVPNALAQLFFFAALMFAVMLLFLWMARGYKYVAGAAAADAAIAASNVDSPHGAEDETAHLVGQDTRLQQLK